jgi:hypothetical protein
VADTADLTPVRGLSAKLFGGAQYRAEVGAAIGESDGDVCVTALVSLLGDPPGKSSVDKECKVLESVGLLTRRREGRFVYLTPQRSLYWALCRELAQRAR